MTRATSAPWAADALPSTSAHLRVIRCALTLLFGLSVGCGSGGGSSESAADAPRVVLGTGRLAFEPLDSGASVPLIAGIQGGYHVWVSFLAYGFETEILNMALATRLDDRVESFPAPVRVSAKPGTDSAGAPAGVMLGWPAVLVDARCSNGREIEVDLDVTDSNGRSASDVRRWVLDVAEVDRLPDCPP